MIMSSAHAFDPAISSKDVVLVSITLSLLSRNSIGKVVVKTEVVVAPWTVFAVTTTLVQSVIAEVGSNPFSM